MNIALLCGHVVDSDPINLRKTADGKPVSSFTLKVPRNSLKDAKISYDYINVIVWGNLAVFCANQLKNGMRIELEGTSKPSRRDIKNVKRIEFIDGHSENKLNIPVFEIVAKRVKILEEQTSEHSMNKVIMCGYVLDDSKKILLRKTKDECAVSSFSLKVQRENSSKNPKESFDFFNVVVWNELAVYATNNLEAGMRIELEGSILTSRRKVKNVKEIEFDDGRVENTLNIPSFDIVANQIKILEYRSAINE